ncbi:MAG: hypothetical protein AAFV88_19375 [Planctomycetota bacterium]
MSEPTAPEPSREMIESLRQGLGSVAATLSAESPDRVESIARAMLLRHSSVLRMRFRDDDDMALPLPPPNLAKEAVPWYDLGFFANDYTRPSRTLCYAAGDYFLQDAGSLLALAACHADRPPETPRLICDLCAAPGGKASGLLESIGGGFLLANEPVKSRVAPLAFNLARTGCDRYTIASQDPERLASQLAGTFDLVLADVPCSGQMLLGRGKQKAASLQASQIEHSCLRAKRILAAAVKLLRPGGQLVLSTCTFAEQENEAQVRWLIEAGDWEMSPRPIDRLASYTSSPLNCTYRLWPDTDRCAGSFAASLTCESSSTDIEAPLPRQRRKNKRSREERVPREEFEGWMTALPSRTSQQGDCVFGWPDGVPSWVETVTVRGPELAYRTGRTWKPSQELAWRIQGGSSPKQFLEVDDATAVEYLGGAAIPCESAGWHVVRWKGRGLGWVKSSNGTGKNQLPAACRFQVDVESHETPLNGG